MSVEDRVVELERYTAVQAWYQEVLAAAKAIDPAATLSDTTGGVPQLVVSSKQIQLTGNDYVAAQQFGLQPEQWLAKAIQGYVSPAEPVVSIPGPPAAIDLLKAGDRFQKDGILFEVFESPFGNMAKRIGPVPPPAPVVPTAASVTAAVVAYITERYTLTADAEAQTELRLLLTFLAGMK